MIIIWNPSASFFSAAERLITVSMSISISQRTLKSAKPERRSWPIELRKLFFTLFNVENVRSGVDVDTGNEANTFKRIEIFGKKLERHWT